MQRNTTRLLIKLRSLEHGGPFTSFERADGLPPVSTSASPLNTGFCSGPVPSAFIVDKYILFLTRKFVSSEAEDASLRCLLSASIRDPPGPLSVSRTRRALCQEQTWFSWPGEAGRRAGLLTLVRSAGSLPPSGSAEPGLDELPGRHSFRPPVPPPVGRGRGRPGPQLE